MQSREVEACETKVVAGVVTERVFSFPPKFLRVPLFRVNLVIVGVVVVAVLAIAWFLWGSK